MQIKRNLISKLSILGAIVGLIYFFAGFKVLDSTFLFFFLSTILYFSFLFMLLGILIVLFFSKIKLDRWHFGALFGYLFYLVCSMLIFVFFSGGQRISFLGDVVFYGPIPGFLLQICLVLLGLLLGNYLSNTQIVKLKVRK